MKEVAVKKEIVSISHIISMMPATGKNKAARHSHLVEPAGEKSSLEDTLEGLRLHVKYIVFDLEATRRENRYLRQMLEARPPRDRERGRDDEGPSSL